MKKLLLLLTIVFMIMACSKKSEKAITTKQTRLVLSEKTTVPLAVPQKDFSLKLKYTTGIRSILEDSKGNYWFGSHQEGVCLFDGESLTYFTTDHGLSNNQVRTIQEDKNGTIWFGTGAGVSSYQKDKITHHDLEKPYLMPSLVTSSSWSLSENDLWFNAGNKSGTYRFDGKQLTHLPFPMVENESEIPYYVMTGFSRGINNNIWIATYGAALGYDGEKFKIIDNKLLGYTESEGYLHIRSILEDSKGNLWIGNNGIGVLLNKGNKIINFSEQQNLIHANSSRSGGYSPPGTLEHVFAISEDLEGNIWFGDRDTGAWRYDGKTMTNFTQADGLSNPFAQTIYTDKKGIVWLGLGNGDLFKFNGKTFDKQF